MQLFLCSIVRQKHSDTLQGSNHVCCYLFLQTFQLSQFCQDSPSFWYAVPVSQIESICPGFYISYQKNVHIYIIFHQQCKTIHLWWIAFIVIHTLNAIKSITVLSSEMIFRKHSIWTFEYYFDRHTFDLIINSGKIVQKNQTKYSCPRKQKVCKRLFETIWVHLVFKCFSATQSWFVALLGMHFQFFVLGSQKIRLECLFLGSCGQKHELTFLHVDTNLGKLMLI